MKQGQLKAVLVDVVDCSVYLLETEVNTDCCVVCLTLVTCTCELVVVGSIVSVAVTEVDVYLLADAVLTPNPCHK